MTKKINLIVEPFQNLLELRRSIDKNGGRIFLRHYFVIENNYFPSKNWTDLSAAILDMWLECLFEIKGTNNILHFMDGNYALRLDDLNDSEYIVHFGSFDEDEFVESSRIESVILEKNLFKLEIVNAANNVIGLFKKFQIDSNEYYFKRLVEKLDSIDEIG